MTTAPPRTLRADPQDGVDHPGSRERVDVAIIGGGISGLSLGLWLGRSGTGVKVFDRAPNPGGVMQTVRQGDFVFEAGPNTILDRNPTVAELIRAVGLESSLEAVKLSSLDRYVWHAGKLHRVPSGLLSFIRSGLLGAGAKAKLMREPWAPSAEGEESLESFISRRLGPEAYERLFVPMVSGTSGGDPAAMSATYNYPALKTYETNRGSIVRGFMDARKANRRARRKSGAASEPTRMVSFKGGLGRLPEALAAALGEAWSPETTVDHIEPLTGRSGYRVRTSRGEWEARQVVVCTEAEPAARLVEPFDTQIAHVLRTQHYCSMTVIGLGIAASAARVPSGFGFLTVRDQGIRVLGAIFNSNFLAGRAPEGSHALTIMMGGDLDPSAIALDDDGLLSVIRADLRRIISWNGRAEEIFIRRWPRAIPQYGLTHAATIKALESLSPRYPGLHFFGNWAGGVAIGDRIEAAQAKAEEIVRLGVRSN